MPPTGALNLRRIASPRWSKSAANTTPGNTVLNQDFKEFVQSLNDNGVRYLIVGGYAVALHGHPRYTKDLDVWIERSPENARRLLSALAHFGFGSLALTSEDFLLPDGVIQLGYPPSRIDLINQCSGVDFAECFARRMRVDVDGVEVSCIDLDKLRENKKATGRHQDLADLENLE